MNVAVKSFMACAIFLTLGHSATAEYDVNAYCKLVQNGVKLASIDDCQTYYTCTNGNAIKGVCPASQAFDKNAKNCRPNSDVKCYLGLEQPCAGVPDETFVPNPTNCYGWIYCMKNAEAHHGQCQLGQYFQQGRCVHGQCNNNANNGGGLRSVCQIMPDGTYFGSTKNCQMWQVCKQDVGLKYGWCEAGYVYDVPRGACNTANRYNCGHVTGSDLQPDQPNGSPPCAKEDNGKIKPDATICSSYQKCVNEKWISNTCENGNYFSPADGRCMSRQEATPVKTCNRCQFSNKQWVNAVDPTCNTYYTCSNGQRVGEVGRCADKSYFDEALQGCLADKNHLTNYVKKNGACKPCAKICEILSVEQCVETEGCACGLNAAATKCQVCENGIESKKCKAEMTCNAEYCKALGDKCAETDECKCGKENNECTLCTSGVVDENGNCKDEQPTPEEDCTVDYCAALGADCKATDECKCGKENNACTLCTSGIVDAKGNCATCDATYCAALGVDCKATAECACALNESSDCIYCSSGVDETSSQCKA